MMNKVLIGLLGAAAIATGGYAAATGLDTDPARTVSLPSATDTGGVAGTTAGATTAGATTAGDISGPCDEAEHRNDPRCTGITVPPATGTDLGVTTDDDDDISGPCDEAEHQNDPRCTGAGTTGEDDDNSGPGDGDDDDDDDNSGPGGGDDDDDRSGSNSGKG